MRAREVVVLPTCCLVAATKIGRDFWMLDLTLVEVVLSARTFDELERRVRRVIFNVMRTFDFGKKCVKSMVHFESLIAALTAAVYWQCVMGYLLMGDRVLVA